jgi:hypothetical protein
MTSIRDEIEGLREDVRALVALVEQLSVPRKTPRQVRLEKRHQRLREVAHATGPISYNTAEEVEAIIDGRRDPPKGQERNVKLLQEDPETPLSVGGIYRVISNCD